MGLEGEMEERREKRKEKRGGNVSGFRREKMTERGGKNKQWV